MTIRGPRISHEEREPKIHKRANSKLKRLKSIISDFATCFFHKIPTVDIDIYVIRNNVKIQFTLKGSDRFRPSEGLPSEDEIRNYESELRVSFNDIFLNEETKMFYDVISIDVGYMKPTPVGMNASDHPKITMHGRFGQIKRVSKKNFLKIEKRLEQELIFLKIMQ